MKVFYLLTFILCLSTVSATAQDNNISKKKFHWRGEQDTTAGYAQSVLVDNVLYISGTVGHGQTMGEQLKTLYAGIERTLKQYGATFQNVVKENLFTTDIEAVKSLNHIRKEYYKGDFPAATWSQITRLYMPSALVEVEVIAHLPRK